MTKKKLIEVALPLEIINKESSREKSIRQGHPSTLHLWWARRPLAAARAVLWASIVNDPSSDPDRFPTEELQNKERERLFRILSELVVWENSQNETLLREAREEMQKSIGNVNKINRVTKDGKNDLKSASTCDGTVAENKVIIISYFCLSVTHFFMAFL